MHFSVSHVSPILFPRKAGKFLMRFFLFRKKMVELMVFSMRNAYDRVDTSIKVMKKLFWPYFYAFLLNSKHASFER